MDGGGDDDGRGSLFSYRHKQAGSSSYTISSSSGTIISTAYTSSCGSRQSSLSTEAAVLLDMLEFDEHTSWIETEKKDADLVRPFKKIREQTEEKEKMVKEKMKEIKILVQEFFGPPSSGDCSTKGDVSVLDRWLKHLGVGWVLHLAGCASVSVEYYITPRDAQSWIRGLAKIIDTIHFVASRCRPDDGRKNHQEPDQTAIEASVVPDELQFTQFIQQAMLKMLFFVDIVVTPTPNTTTLKEQYDKLSCLLLVRKALLNVWFKIRLPMQHSRTRVQVERLHHNLFSAKVEKTAEAIWSTIERTRTELMDGGGGNNWSRSLADLQGSSSDIHEATRSVMRYIDLMCSHYSSVAPIICEAVRHGSYVPRMRQFLPFTSLVIEMLSCLAEKLPMPTSLNCSDNRSVRFLFLLNNSHFIAQQLRNYLSSFTVHGEEDGALADLVRKVEGYIEHYRKQGNFRRPKDFRRATAAAKE